AVDPGQRDLRVASRCCDVPSPLLARHHAIPPNALCGGEEVDPFLLAVDLHPHAASGDSHSDVREGLRIDGGHFCAPLLVVSLAPLYRRNAHLSTILRGLFAIFAKETAPR